MSVAIEIFKLHFDSKLSLRRIAAITETSKSTVANYLKMFEQSGLKWPLDQNLLELGDLGLSQKLKPDFVSKKTNINYDVITKQLQNKNVTLKLLHKELTQGNKLDLSYSHFVRLVKSNIESTCYMKQIHIDGEKVFVDYSGDKAKIIQHGKEVSVEVFVGVLGASSYLYVDCTYNQKQESFIGSHVRMFKYFGGTPKIVVPDNLKSAVITASKHNPIINQEYKRMLDHYEMLAIPARVRKPKDKSLVENGVRIAQREILAVIRNETFYSLEELNKRVLELVDVINNRKLSNSEFSRKEQFLNKDLPALKKLTSDYRYLKYKKIIVGGDYHFKLDNVNYSVPYQYAYQSLDVYYNDTVIDCFFDNKKLLTHQKSLSTVTIFEHMPKNHQFIAKPKETIIKDLLPNTKTIVENIYANHHKEIATKLSMGLLKSTNSNNLEIICEQFIQKNIYDPLEIMTSIKKRALSSNLTFTQTLPTFI